MNLDALLKIKATVSGEESIRRLGNSMQGLQGKVKNASMGFNSLKGAVGGFAAAIAGSAIVAGLSAAVKQTINLGDELGKLSARTGVAQGALIGLRNAAALSDVSNESLAKSLTRLNVNLVAAAEGNEALTRRFQSLGVNIRGANGQVVSADKALKQLADRFANMPDGAQKAAAAVQIFGKSGADLIPLLNSGSEAMEKFTFAVSEDFSARSELFNDTITELGFKTQGFQLQLADALLPALQSILEVFGDLFSTEQDWTALFDVIKFGLRTVASFIYVTIKLVDQWIKSIAAAFEAIGKAFRGDFAGAAEIFKNRMGSFLQQAQRDFAQLQKIWTDSPSPGTGSRRRTGRNMALDTGDADRDAAAAARKAAEKAKRAASEQERLLERRNDLTQKAISLQQQLQNSVADVAAAYAGVGASPTDQLFLERNEAITENDRQVKQLTLSVVELAREINAAGGSLDVKPFADLIDRLSAANVALADQNYLQGLKDLLPSLEEYDAKIAEVTRGKTELTELEKLNAEVNLLQLDILAQTNPALAEHVRLLRERAAALDAATEKQKKDSESIGAGIQQRLQDYYNSVKDLGGAIGDAVVSGLQGLEDRLTEFVTTGKANFKELAASILSDLARIALRAAIIQPIVQALGGLFLGFKFANGGIMTGDGPVPLKKYANGGIARSPQLALYGEGSMAEAYVPLPDGRRIPVAMQGGGGGSTVVNVSVDAKGTSVQGNSGQGEQLGRAISQAVQAELIKQRRPGGLLAAA
jgi:hypothetical protein